MAMKDSLKEIKKLCGNIEPVLIYAALQMDGHLSRDEVKLIKAESTALEQLNQLFNTLKNKNQKEALSGLLKIFQDHHYEQLVKITQDILDSLDSIYPAARPSEGAQAAFLKDNQIDHSPTAKALPETNELSSTSALSEKVIDNENKGVTAPLLEGSAMNNENESLLNENENPLNNKNSLNSKLLHNRKCWGAAVCIGTIFVLLILGLGIYFFFFHRAVFSPWQPIEICPERPEYQGTIRDWPKFDPEYDAQLIKSACIKTLFGTICNETKVIEIACLRSNSQRQKLKNRLDELFENNFTGLINNYQLFLRPEEYDYAYISLRTQKIENRKKIQYCHERIVEIMVSSSNDEIRVIDELMKKAHKTDFEQVLKGLFQGNALKILMMILKRDRNETWVCDYQEGATAAEKLLRKEQWGEDQFEIFMKSNAAQMQLIFRIYKNLSGGLDIEETISTLFNNYTKIVLLTIVNYTRSPTDYFANAINNSFAITQDKCSFSIFHAIIGRSEKDLVQIKQSYLHLFNPNSIEDIINSLSWDENRKYVLLCLLQGNDNKSLIK